MKKFFERNKNWQVNICDNRCKEEFINTTFHGTAVEWAFYLINPVLGAARADIWRYAVLFTYGGVYLDDDSDIRTPLDDVIGSTEEMVMTEEGASSLGECYVPSFHLSDKATFAKYDFDRIKARIDDTPYFHKFSNISKYPEFFHGNTLVNWGIFVRPRHPVIRQTIFNIIEILRAEYYRPSVIAMARWDIKWKMVMCTTNFVMTMTLREMLLEHTIFKRMNNSWIPKIHTNNFAIFGGRVKAIWTGNDPHHYMKLMVRKSIPLLLAHRHVSQEQQIAFLEGQPVQGDVGRDIFLIRGGVKMPFGDYQTFLDMGFATSDLRHVRDGLLSAIPTGKSVPPVAARRPTATTASHAPAQATTAPPISVKVLPAAALEEPPVVMAFNSEGSKYSFSPSVYTHGVSESLKAFRDLVNATALQCYGDDYSGSRDEVVKDRWRTELNSAAGGALNGSAVYVYPKCLRLFQLGNSMGYYLNDVACANISGSHFVGWDRKYELIEEENLLARGDNKYAFFKNLPDIIINPDSRNIEIVRSTIKRLCPCVRYCWENAGAPWLQRIPMLMEIVRHAIDAYAAAAGVESTVVNVASDLVYRPSGISETTALPLVPTVAVQYRCGDNIGFGKTRYGLMPFYALRNKLKRGVKYAYIYIIADSPGRNPTPYSSRCGVILEALFKNFKQNFPESVVLVKRGGDQFLDWKRLAYANVTICSASSFCLWPALSNAVIGSGTSYFPLTPLLASTWELTMIPPSFKPFRRFNFMAEDMLKEFKQFKPWDTVIDALLLEPVQNVTVM